MRVIRCLWKAAADTPSAIPADFTLWRDIQRISYPKAAYFSILFVNWFLIDRSCAPNQPVYNRRLSEAARNTPLHVPERHDSGEIGSLPLRAADEDPALYRGPCHDCFEPPFQPGKLTKILPLLFMGHDPADAGNVSD